MKEIVILSGKGGTGKTSVTAALAHLAQCDDQSITTVLVDADVDAANLELLLTPQVVMSEDFYGGQEAVIDQDMCGGCGTCFDTCRFGAIHQYEDRYEVNTILCEGCAACVYQCPQGAIRMDPQIAGQWFHSSSRYGDLLHAQLIPARENSGKLVALVKERGRDVANQENADVLLVDGPPGIGCPAISAISGADLALLVTEPTIAGIHDLERIWQLTQHFKIPAYVCVNKADLSLEKKEDIERFCSEQGIKIVGYIPFDVRVTEAMVNGKPVTEFEQEMPVSLSLKKIWERIAHLFNIDRDLQTQKTNTEAIKER